MDVKTLASQRFLEIVKDIKRGKASLEAVFRLQGLLDVFGERNVGFVLVKDLQNEIKTGKKAPVYAIDNSFSTYKISEGVECNLFLPTSFVLGDGVFPSRSQVEDIVDYLDEFKKKGYIKNIVNSKKGTLSEDKIHLLDLQSQGINVPYTHHFENFSQFKDFVEYSNGSFVLKHRFGEGGKGTRLVNQTNIHNYSKLCIDDYVVQEKVDILSESRLIFFEEELIGSRIIVDRHMPWEKKGSVNRRHLNKEYTPSQKEIIDMQTISKLFDATVGCIDFIEVKGGAEKLVLEYNGVGTGWGDYPEIDPYNLNKTVPKKLKEKYLSN